MKPGTTPPGTPIDASVDHEPPEALSEERLHRFLRRLRRRAPSGRLPPLGSLLGETLGLAQRLVPCRGGALLLDDPTAKAQRKHARLTVIAAFGKASERAVGTILPVDDALEGQVYRSGTIRTWPRPAPGSAAGSVQAPHGFRPRALLAAPLRLETDVCGLLELYDRRGRKSFTERDTELAALVARTASGLILNAVDVLKQNELALHDDLTGLYNVRALGTQLGAEVRRARRKQGDLALLFVDMDGLKRVNDTRGHSTGSEAIRRCARLIASGLGDHGLAFRFGGDEMVAICPAMNAEDALALAEHLRQRVAARMAGASGRARVPAMTVSIGVATLEQARRAGCVASKPPLSESLLSAADRALYRAKRKGRNRSALASRRDFHPQTR